MRKCELAMLIVVTLHGVAFAQAPWTRTNTAPNRTLPISAMPEPAARGEELPSFVKSLSSTDTRFEVIVGQGRLITLTQDLAVAGQASPLVAVGDPTVVDFEVIGPRHIRVIGLRVGATDLSIVTGQRDSYSMEVHVVPDLDLLRARLFAAFPDARVELASMRQHVVVEGEARDTRQVAQIVEMVEAYVSTSQSTRASASRVTPLPAAPEDAAEPDTGLTPPGLTPQFPTSPGPTPEFETQLGPPRAVGRGPSGPSQVINLLRVPGVQQVLLKVRIAELNRTALRQTGADILGVDPSTGNIVGTSIAGSLVEAAGLVGSGGLTGAAEGATGASTTAFGIFPSGDFEILLQLLRRNSLLTILAEPNLVALNGHQASFLAGGEFPVPVPQGGPNNNVTIEFRQFGVRLDFLPFVLDNETVRLTVTPEVSSIDFALGTTLVAGGDPVPGLSTRRTQTTVELRQTQTLAISGLLRVDRDAQTSRIPGLGDLPYIGPLFSSTRHNRVEKELLILITPYLVQPMEQHELGPLPGEEIKDPNDSEFYLMNRMEGRTDSPYRPTTDYELFHRPALRDYDRHYMHGPGGATPPQAMKLKGAAR